MDMIRFFSSLSLATFLSGPGASASTPPWNVRMNSGLLLPKNYLFTWSLFADPMQLVDELSMIYTTCLMCYATFSYSKSRLYSFLLALGLVSLALFITLYYHYLQDPAFHQTAYAILTAVVFFRSVYVMEFTLRPSLTKKEDEFKVQRKRSMNVDEKEVSRLADSRDAKILSTMWVMIVTGLSIFLTGFLIWNLDNAFCPKLRIWRRQIGLPWGVILEGHGWW